jgi:hypothetical protein
MLKVGLSTQFRQNESKTNDLQNENTFRPTLWKQFRKILMKNEWNSFESFFFGAFDFTKKAKDFMKFFTPLDFQ